MTDEIATKEQWNPQDMAAQVRDKIRLQVAELIPPEMWKQLIEDEVRKFTTVTTERHGYQNRDTREVRPGIEPMINTGRRHGQVLADEWTVVTVDGSLSAQWEHTVCVTETGVDILTI